MKTTLINLAGGRNRLAAVLGITGSAVSQWPGEHVPPRHIKTLRRKRPYWFRPRDKVAA